MPTADVVLQLDIEAGRYPDVEVVARGLLAWSESLKASAAVIDPEGEWVVELLGVEPGSQRFKQLLKRVQGFAERVEAGGAEYPLVKQHAQALMTMIIGAVVVVGVNEVIQPDPRIPDDQMAVFQKQNELLKQSLEVQRANQRLFSTLLEDRAIERVRVYRGQERTPTYQIPREEFFPRSGLWTSESQTEVGREETRRAVWDVVLIKPVLRPQERRWTFSRDGLEFTATMTDPAILEAIRNRTLPIPMIEGVRMKVEIDYRERFDGQSWRPITASRRVRRVLEPALPPPSTPLFPTPGGP